MSTSTTVPQYTLPTSALLIGGEWSSNASGGEHLHVNPATGKTQAAVPLAGVGEVQRAVAAARMAFPAWSRMPVNRRRDIMWRFSELIERNAEELAVIGALENGKPLSQGGKLSMPAEWARYYAGWIDKLPGEVVPAVLRPGLDYVLPEPYGVIAVVLPWNGPFTIAAMSAVPALAAGNTVVIKPPELAPFTMVRFGEMALEAGFPPGVVNIITGGPEAGDALVRHPDVDKITFTGGVTTAKSILHAAADSLTPSTMELGGKSANLVFADADLDSAVNIAINLGVVVNSGQGCALPTRLLVQDSIYDEMVDRLIAVAQKATLGDPLLPDTVMGPVISEASLARIEGIIDRTRSSRGGSLVEGGARAGGSLSNGFFLQPTIFVDVDPDSELARTEVFGPVLAVTRFRDEAHAVELANRSLFGLGAFVSTRDLAVAHRVAADLNAGYVSVNGFAALTPAAPFGGVKNSGFGREGGRAGIEEFLRQKNVFIAL
jgi:acyl-CoA reductase-like NAD-dependent aldehyde dehydrogenase